MGESHAFKGPNRRRIWALVAVLLALGCTSAGVKKARTEGGSDSAGAVSSSQVSTPAEIRSLALNEEGRSAVLEIAADRALVWTNYRDATGNLVLELPNSQPSPSLQDRLTGSGLVSSVEVEVFEDADRPLTRLVVRTREDSEHSLSSDGDVLRLQLLPVGEEEPTALAYEPLPEEGRESKPPAAASAPPAGTTAYGTVDAPQPGPAPTGVAASQLFSVEVLETGSERTRIQVVGDGEFDYTTFRLADPERFVIDLVGVISTSSRNTVPVGDAQVEQVRIGQFKPRPDPVSRVVFDLRKLGAPMIERSADGLTVTFGSAPAASATLAQDVGSAPAPSPPAPTPPPQTTGSMAADEEEPVMVADLGQAEDVEGSEGVPLYEPEPEPAPTPAPPPKPAAMSTPTVTGSVTPPPRPTAPRSGTADVSQFESQEVQVGDKVQEEEPMIPRFDAVFVNRRDRQYVGEPISMSLKNADLVETLRSFAKISDLNFVIQPGVAGSVTVELKNVPWDQAMEQILKINNLGMDIDGTIVRIAPATQLEAEAKAERALIEQRMATVPLRTVMKSLSYAQADTVATLLRNRSGSILSQRGTVQVDPRTNTLIIRELPSNIETVLAVIENLDGPEPQVNIEARIVESTKTFNKSLGIQWGYEALADQAHGNTTGLTFPNNLASDGGVGLLTGGANGFINLSMGNILNTFNLNARLQVAESQGLVNVVSAPSITVLNNFPASIQSGLQIPVQTVSNRTVSTQFVSATLQLTVIPHVTAEGTIFLIINVAKRQPQLALAIVGATAPPIATKQAATTVIVRDGGTAVIGGIYTVSHDNTEDRVPGLANIPVLGHLFKNRNRNRNNDELMIFITPRIVQM